MVYLSTEKDLEILLQLMQDDIDKAIATLYENPKISEFEKINEKIFNPNSTVQLRSFTF